MTYIVRRFAEPDRVHVTYQCDSLDERGDPFSIEVDCWFDQICGAGESYITSGWIMREQTFTAMCLKWPPSKILGFPL